MSDIAIAHNSATERGGAEIVAEQLATQLDAPLYVGHGSNTLHKSREIKPESLLHTLMDKHGLPNILGHYFHWRDNAPSVLDEYDVVVTSGAETNWWVPTNDEQTVVQYSHATPWFQTHRFDEVQGPFSRTKQQVFRYLFETHMTTPDLWVANSELVARRLERYWGAHESKITTVYPPVATELFGPDVAPTEDYYLSLSRLGPEKRVPAIIEAAKDANIPLKVAGDGPQREQIQSMTGEAVEYVGEVNGQEKAKLLSGAKAVLTACKSETFGMVPVEALASGTPVIAPNSGYTQYQLSDGDNAILDPKIRTGIRRFEDTGVTWSPGQMAKWADVNFSVSRFQDEMQSAIKKATNRATVNPEYTNVTA